MHLRFAQMLVAVGVVSPASPAGADFVDVTNASGDFLSLPTWGAQAIDLDGDGDIDLLRAHHHYGARIHTNDGYGSFSMNGMEQIAEDGSDRHGFLWADLDNDGVLDGVCSHGGNGGCGCSDDGNELWRGLGGGAFERVEESGGIRDQVGRGRAFSAADIDGDGDLDLFHAKAPLGASPNSVYRNDGNLSFVDVASQVGLDEHLGTVGALFADYDDDGDPDVLLGGEEFGRPTTLYRNDGGVFVDVRDEAFPSWFPVIAGADWGDYDNDGDLDLAVCQGSEGVVDAYGIDDEGTFWFFAHHRFHDDGIDGFTFHTPGENPVAEFLRNGEFVPELIFLGPYGVNPAGDGGSDGNEGPIDLGRRIVLDDQYVGAPRFEPGVDHGLYVWRITAGGPWAVYVSAPPGTFGNFSGRIRSQAGARNASAGSLEHELPTRRSVVVFRNEGDGTFTNVKDALGIGTSINPRAVKWVDFDNDGDLDLHQMNKGTMQLGNEPDCLWRNDGDRFTPLTGPGWVPGASDFFTDGGVWADFDRDGDLDLAMQEGAPPLFLAEGTKPLIYRNDAASGNWISLLALSSPTGTPVGTKVTACAGDLRVHRRVEANSWRGFQSPFRLHFGLGERTVVDSLVIDWPDGRHESIGPFPANVALQHGPSSPTDAGPLVPAVVAHAGPIFPQPARGWQSIRLYSPVESRALVSVFDVSGRRIRVIADRTLPPGENRITWDGRDEAGRPVPAGVYFLRGEGAVPFLRKAIRLR